MKDPVKTARDIAVQFLTKPKRLGMTDAGYHNARETYEFDVETASRTIAFGINQDRSAIRSEVTETAARIAETEFAGNAKWDVPVFSAKGAGKWIGTAIRSTLARAIKTNNPPHGAVGMEKETPSDARPLEGKADQSASRRPNSQAA